MALRLRRDKLDLEEGQGHDVDYDRKSAQDLLNRNAELETLLSNLKSLLDLSRHREKKLITVLQEAGIEAHVDMDIDSIEQVEGSFFRAVIDRSSWLIGLLICQSLSSYILSYNEGILQRHPNIIFFLTMLVGAGGKFYNIQQHEDISFVILTI
jgi:hypothetical protein